MNPYLKHLCKIEFVVTYACTGRCIHCSEGSHDCAGTHIDPDAAAEAVRAVAGMYDIRTVMTFGGEPLLYPDAVCRIMQTAGELKIAKRQVITNGYFSKHPAQIQAVAARLAEAGVNDLLLSADAFHQESIPLETVTQFAEAATACRIPLRIQPAWLVSSSHDNPYNRKTREIIEHFAKMGIPCNEGNIIFPEGNAKKFLAGYFAEEQPQNPYREDPHDVRCLSFDPDGSVLGGSIAKQHILEILDHYRPDNRMEESR